ncbi:unnamed protein product [Closterium sp. NIES-54]
MQTVGLHQQQLHEWVVQRVSLGGSGRCLYVDEYGDEVIVPNWLKLQGMGVDVYALEFVQINKAIYAMYVTELSDEGACYSCVPGDAGVDAAALGAIEFAAAPGASEYAASAEALHTFTLDSGASRSVPSGSLSGLHLPTFSTNLVSNAALQDVWLLARVGYSTTFSPLAPPPRSPSLPRLRSMHSRLLVSGPPRSLPSLHRSLAPPCIPCVEGRQRAAPHSSEFPPTTAPLQTRYMDIRATRRKVRERFRQDLPVQRLHSDRGGEFSFDLLAEFCQDESIHKSSTIPASPQKNGIAERLIGLIMEVAPTSLIHAAAPHFLWPFAVRYAAHQLNLWPHVSLPETSPTLCWSGEVGDALVFRVWGALSLVRDTTASKLSTRTLCCVFLGFPTDAPLWQFYHPRSHRVFSSRDATFDESVCFYRLHPHASHPVPLAPLFLVDPPPLVEPLEISFDSSGPSEGGDPAADDTAASRRSPRLETPPVFPPRLSSPPPQPAAVDSGAEAAGAEPGGAETEGEGSGGAATRAVGDPAGGPRAGQPPRPDLLETLSPQAIRAWIVRRGRPGGGGYSPAGAGAASPGGAGGIAGGTRGAAGAGGTGAASPGGTGGATGAGGAVPTSSGGPPGAGGAAATGTGGAGATRGTGGAGAAGPGGPAGAGGAGGTAGGVGGAASAGVNRGATGAGGTAATSPAGPRGAGGAGVAGGATSAGGTGAAGAGDAAAAGAGGARSTGRGAGAGGAGATTTGA